MYSLLLLRKKEVNSPQQLGPERRFCFSIGRRRSSRFSTLNNGIASANIAHRIATRLVIQSFSMPFQGIPKCKLDLEQHLIRPVFPMFQNYFQNPEQGLFRVTLVWADMTDRDFTGKQRSITFKSIGEKLHFFLIYRYRFYSVNLHLLKTKTEFDYLTDVQIVQKSKDIVLSMAAKN